MTTQNVNVESATPLGADETSSQFPAVECVRSFTYAPPGNGAWEKVGDVQSHFDRYRYVIGKEKGAKGHHHLEIAVINHKDENHNGTRDFARAVGCGTKKPELSVRRHNGDKAMEKIGYAMKEGNYVTNVDDEEFLASCVDAYNKSVQATSMSGVARRHFTQSVVYVQQPRRALENVNDYIERVELARKHEVAKEFARGALSYEQAIKLGCQPKLMSYWTNFTKEGGVQTSSTSSTE